MLTPEVSDFINTLIGQNLSKLDIIQRVMDTFGARFPEYSFRKWCGAISDLVDNEEKANTIQPTSIPTPERRKTSNYEPTKTNPAQTYQREINFEGLKEHGFYTLKFGDRYTISKTQLVDLFKLAVLHIGPMRIKELNIKTGNVYLISYVRTYNNKDVQYPLYSACYLYVKLNVNEIVEKLYDILQQLSIRATLEKGNRIIFKTLFKNVPLQKPIQKSADPIKQSVPQKVSKPTISPTASFNHPDIIPPTSSKPIVDYRAGSGLKTILYYIDKIKKIRVSNISGQKAPHKPIFILTLFELIQKEHVRNNQFRFDMNMNNVFIEVWNRHNNRTVFHKNIASPFVSLTLDGFWTITQMNPNQKLVNTTTWIKRNVEYGSLDTDLYNILQDRNNRNAIKHAIIEHFNLKQ